MGLFIRIYDIAMVLVCLYFVGRVVWNYIMKKKDGVVIVSVKANEDKQMRLFLTIVSCGLMVLLALTYLVGLLITLDSGQAPIFLVSLLLTVIFYFLFNGKYEVFQSGFFTAFSFYHVDQIEGYMIKKEGSKAFIGLKLANGRIKRLTMSTVDKTGITEVDKGLKALLKSKRP